MKLSLICGAAFLVLAALSGSLEGAPAIFWVSDPVGPGEAAMVIGDGFGDVVLAEVERIPDRPGSGPGNGVSQASGRAVSPIQATEQSLKFVVPQEFPPGVFALRIKTVDGASSWLINAPTVYWAQGDQGKGASPGGWIRIFGRCIGLDSKGVRLLMKSASSAGDVSLQSSSASPWEARFELPANTRPGSYKLWLYNGMGDQRAWGEGGSIQIGPREPWPETLYNVRDFGALGTGVSDDTKAILSAVKAAGDSGGGVVFFPRGRYMISEALVVPRFTVLRGEGVELSCLFWRPGRDERITAPPPAALIQGTNSFGVEDMAVYSQYYQHVIVGDLGDKADAGDIFLRRVRVRANLYTGHLKPEEVDRRFREALKLSTGGGDTVRLGGRNIEITDCDFYGAGRAIFLSRVRDGMVARNSFYNGRWGWYSISGSDRLIFEKNRIIGADLMSTGGGLSPDGSGYSQNIYYAFNKLELMHGWDREGMTSDGGGGAYSGRIEWAEGRRMSLADSPKWGGNDRRGMGVFILDGRGKGQFRILSSYDGTIIEVDQPWIIQPDASSHISITMLQRNYLIIGNEFRDATSAVQFYGTSIGHVVAENKSWRAGGFHNIGMNYAGGWQPSWFVQFLHNEIAEGNQGFNGPMNEFPPVESHVAALGIAYSPTGAAMNRFTIIRGNKLRNNARIEIGGACEDVIVDDNLVENADVGVTVGGPGSYHGGDPFGVLLHGNQFEKVNVPLSDYTGKALTVPAN